MHVARTHDIFYLTEDRKHAPKEYFKFIGEYTFKFIKKFKNPKVLDIGCATGDFLWYIHLLHPYSQIYGIDVMPQLIEQAKKEVPAGTYFKADIYTGEGLPDMKFDVVFMFGVHPIFDDYVPWINNLIKLISPEGRAFVFGIFNPYDIDVLVKARRSLEEGPWEMGWNLFSKKTIGHYLESLKIRYKFIDWNTNIDLTKKPEDLFRAWTLKLENGKRIEVSGVGLLLYSMLLEIQNNDG